MVFTTDGTLGFSAFQVAPAGENYEMEFLRLVASLGEVSGDALLLKVTDISRRNNLRPWPVIGYEEFEGLGLGGAVEVGPGVYRAVVVGTPDFVRQCGLNAPETLVVAARQWESEGALVVRAGWDGWVRGILRFSLLK